MNKVSGAACDSCALRAGDFVNPPPKIDAKLIVVGEGPGTQEVATGLYFNGASGRFVRAYVESNGLVWGEVSLDNATACKPTGPLSDSQWAHAVQCCSGRFTARMATVNPEAPVVALGKHAISAVTGIHKHKAILGSVVPTLPLPVVRQCITAMHPAAAMRKGMRAHLPIIGAFIGRGAVLAQGKLKQHVWPTMYTQPGKEALAALKRIRRSGLTVALDIEDYGDDDKSTLMAVGIGTTKEVVSMPWDPYVSGKYGPVPGLRERTYGAAIEREILGILYEANIVCHNGPYDVLRLRRRGVHVRYFTFDTLVAHALVAPNVDHTLHMVAVSLLNTDPWKFQFKATSSEKGALAFIAQPELTLRQYNAKDVGATAAVCDVLESKLDAIHMGRENFDMLMELTRISMEMTDYGIQVSQETHRKHRRNIRARLRRLEEPLRALATELDMGDFNPNSGVHVARLFEEKLEVEPVATTDTGASSWDEEALATLTKHDSPVVRYAGRLQLQYRRVRKLLQDHVVLLRHDANWVVHPKWKPWGAQTGRWSCNAPNLQTVPKGSERITRAGRKVVVLPSLRNLYVARPGMTLVKADMAQLEARIATQQTNDKPLLEGFMDPSRSVHHENAMALFSIALRAHVTEVQKTFAKNFLYGNLYLGSAEAVQSILAPDYPDITVDEIAFFMARFDEAHPELRASQQEMIQFVKDNDYIEVPLGGRRRYFFGRPEPTELTNYPVQGFGAYLMNKAVLGIWPKLDRAAGEMILIQCHDELVLEGPDPDRLVKLLRDHMDQTHTINGVTMRYPIEIAVGQDWRNLEKVS